MKKTISITVPPEVAYDPIELRARLASKLRLSENDQWQFRITRRSIDARKRPIRIPLQIDVYLDEPLPEVPDHRNQLQDVSNNAPVIIIGAGPAGLFSALKLIELGLKPIIFERGKDVRARRRDIAAINQKHIVNPDSNYCFGEGGAGTYSDGKLYTRSTKRGDTRSILEILVNHGAPEEILIDAHPHIGTNKLPKVVTAIRESILDCGGEIHFNTPIASLVINGSSIAGVVDRSGIKHLAEATILATGHSARDIYTMLHDQQIAMESKPFALGLRVEHPQALIDKIQYHGCERGMLPAASYSLSYDLRSNKAGGVFSFCMCPGGFIVPAATSPGEVVVNGMSPSRRDSQFANSGIVVSVSKDDFGNLSEYGSLAGMHFQRIIEQKACSMTGGNQTAPAQRLMDFMNNRVSNNLPETSYQPGVSPINLSELLPDKINVGLKKGFRAFGKRMKGYLTNEAVLLGVESRTSAPVKIPRDPITLQHIEISGLIPCGEGAGYAGGIMSAAIDGFNCGLAANRLINKQ